MAKLLAAVSAAAAVALCRAGHGEPYMYTVTGACDAQDGLDGETFVRAGHTASGAPYYKALHTETYMYYDPDCMGSTDGTPRWIIDRNKPNTTAANDLDGDGFCDYIARVDSADPSHPPTQGHWIMICAGRKESQYLILLEGTTTTTTPPPTTTLPPTTTIPAPTTTIPAPTTTIPAPTTTLPSSSTTPVPTTTAPETTQAPKNTTTMLIETTTTGAPATPTTEALTTTEAPSTTEATDSTTESPATTTVALTTEAPQDSTVTTTRDGGGPVVETSAKALMLSGACAVKGFLNGLIFDEAGTTFDGRPFFKARGFEQYLYWDRDCDESGSTSASRWILDNIRPSTAATQDLDGDGKCDYHGRIDGESKRPPATAAWTLYCGAASGGWTSAELSLTEASPASPASPGDGAQIVSATPRLAAPATVLALVLGLTLGA